MYLYIVKMITEPGTTNPTIAWVEGIPKHRKFKNINMLVASSIHY